MRILLSTLALLCAFSSFSQSQNFVSEDVAQQVAERWYLQNNAGSAESVQVPAISLTRERNIYQVRYGDDGGFLLISADYRTWPVLAWGEGSLSGGAEGLPGSYRWHIENYQLEIGTLTGTASPEMLQEWQTFTADAFQPPVLPGVSPLLQSSWGQGCKYNSLCPVDSLATGYYCYHVPTGCVSTALGQIMRYWEYPANGQGSHSYTHPTYGLQSVNFGGTSYNWTNMPVNPGNAATSIPTLMYHLGVSVNMAFGPQNSGSYASDARGALVNYFGYDAGAIYRQRVSFSDNQWHNLLKTELEHGRPVFYGGLDPNGYGGHAWVVDGYDGQHYHINWGWDGALNGYFLLSSLNPQGNANFTNLHEAIMGITPGAASLKARFVADRRVVSPGDSIFFEDVSTGSPTSWKWQFPGSTLPVNQFQAVPAVVYPAPGLYDVTLIVGKTGSSDTLLMEDFIRVLPLADFRSSSTKTEAGGRIDFFDASELAGGNVNYEWAFPGGIPSSSTSKNPAGVRYNSAGIYAVSLKVSSPSAQHTVTKQGYIKVFIQCDTMLLCDVDFPCVVQPGNAAGFQVVMHDLDQRVPYYASLGHTSSWIRFNKVLAPGDTNFFYGATSWFVPAGKADNWLVFGPVSIPPAGAEFQWSHLYWLNHKRDGYEVLVSSAGSNPGHFTAAPIASRLDNDPGTEGDTVWKENSAPLPQQYNGQDVYLAFHHTANDMSYLFLDDFRVLNCAGLPGIGFAEAEAGEGLVVAPNPAIEEVRIRIPRSSHNSELIIRDMNGRTVVSLALGKDQEQAVLKLDGFSHGLYMVELRQQEGRRFGRLAVL